MLADKLAEIREGAKSRIPEDKRNSMARATQEIRDSHIEDRAIKQGDRLPPFSLPDSENNTVTSAQLLQQGNLVITFYRGVW